MDFSEPVANALSLELVNTVNSWHRPTRDALADPSSTASWAAHVGHPLATTPRESALPRARSLRGQLHAVFGAIAGHGEPSAQGLAAIERAYREGLAAAHLRRTGPTYGLAWPEPGSLDDLLARAAASAVTLLTAGPLDRVGECPSCGWLFLDTSRNGRRRWCSMDTCGARVKARRHYATRTAAT